MPASRRPDDLTILIVTFVLMAVLTVTAFLVAPVDSSPRTTGSSFSTRADGAKAAYLVLKQLGHAVDRSYDPITAITREPGETILILASPTEGPSRQDVRTVRNFVENGGVLLAYGLSAAPFVPGVKVRDDDAELDDKPREFPASVPSGLTVEAPLVIARTIPAPELDSSFVPVFGSLREPAVVSARLGRGRIVWSLDDSPITNEGLPRASNVRLLANAAGTPGARRILWDEHYHGQRRSMWSYFAGTPLPWAGAQLLFAALVALIAVGRRRGPVRTRIVAARTSPLEFVDTMASLYERAGAERAAVEGARAQLRRRLAAASGAPRSASDNALAKAAGERLGIDGKRAAAAFASAADLLRHGIARTAEAIPVVAELQELAAAAAQAKSGRTIREHR
jgi:hypothetical protein